MGVSFFRGPGGVPFGFPFNQQTDYPQKTRPHVKNNCHPQKLLCELGVWGSPRSEFGGAPTQLTGESGAYASASTDGALTFAGSAFGHMLHSWP